CRVRASFGGGLSHAVATIRFSPSQGTTQWLTTEAMPKLPQRKGLTSAHLLESQPSAGAAQTTEQKIRGSDATADSVLLIGGYDIDALKAVLEEELIPHAFVAI